VSSSSTQKDKNRPASKKKDKTLAEYMKEKAKMKKWFNFLLWAFFDWSLVSYQNIWERILWFDNNSMDLILHNKQAYL